MARARKHAHAPPLDYSATSIRGVDWSTELEVVRGLFREYRAWLADHASPSTTSAAAVHPGLAQMDRLISELPGAYGPPSGDVLLAIRDAQIVACGALRPWAPSIAEIKRISVRPDHRGPVFGRRLTQALLDRAGALGYQRVRVDTLASMAAAIAFYHEAGFRPIPAYWDHPAPGALFFEWRRP